jgi:hypothetical protein
VSGFFLGNNPEDLFYNNSYFYKKDELPNLKNIAEYLIIQYRKEIEIRDPNLFGNLNDILIKIGFIYFSHDQIKDIMENKFTDHSDKILYFLSSLIYSCKAFLDSIAVLLNEFYNLNKSKGDIDLEKDNFLIELKKVNLNILCNFEKEKLIPWIKKVKRWRDAYIHRMSIIVARYGHGAKEEPTEDELGNEGIKMIKEPILFSKIIELITNYDPTKMRMGDLLQDILPFCEEWVNNATKILNIVLEDLATNLKKES